MTWITTHIPTPEGWKAELAMSVLLFGRLERLEYLAQKFKSKCDNHEEWASGKDDMLRNRDYKNCRLNELKVRICCR